MRPLRLPSGQRGGDKLSGGRADLRGLRTGAGSVPPEDPAGREEVRRDCPDGKSRMTDKRTLTTKKTEAGAAGTTTASKLIYR